jgi:hypothetical protein
MHSISGALKLSFPTVRSYAHTAPDSLIGKYTSTPSCSISLFSYYCRYVWSLLLHRIHMSLISLYVSSKIIRASQISTSLALNFRRVLAILAPLFVYFLLSSYVPLPDGIVSSGMSDTFTLVTARYSILGIFILGLLLGLAQ